MKPGFYNRQELSSDDYHAGSGISVTGLKLLGRSPAHYRAGFKSQSTALVIGTALHAAALEPEDFDEEFVVAEGFDSRRDKGYKRWSEQQDRHIILPKEMEDVTGMKNALQHNRDASMLLSGAAFETSCFANDPETGELCRCRFDAFTQNGYIVDLKTTTDARPQAVARKIADLGYYIQQAFYTDVPFWATGQKPLGFVFVFVEKEPPYAVCCYELDGADVARGRAAYRKLLNRYHECKSSENWPAYGSGIQKVELPAWKRNEIDGQFQ